MYVNSPSVVEIFSREELLVFGEQAVEGAAGVGRGDGSVRPFPIHFTSAAVDAVQLLQRFVLVAFGGTGRR